MHSVLNKNVCYGAVKLWKHWKYAGDMVLIPPYTVVIMPMQLTLCLYVRLEEQAQAQLK